MAMALGGQQAVAMITMASLQQPSFLADCGAASSSSSVMFSGRRIHMRVAPPRLFYIGHIRAKYSSRRGRNDSIARAGLASPLSVAGVDQILETDDGQSKATDVELFACPVCFQPLYRNGIPGLSIRAISRSGFQCKTCKKAYSSRNSYLDLTVTANAKAYSENRATGTELFRNPLVSFAYERGWRQNFQGSGFPGPDEEVKLAQEYFKSMYGGVLLDVSCGSGLFTRRFASLGLYSAVIAIDFSENMLRQTIDYIKEDAALPENIALVRADVARMPFATGSVKTVFAGAALHCWPSPSAGVAEISRILCPGGIFVATTFLILTAPQFLPQLPLPPQLRQIEFPNTSSTFRYWNENELEDLVKICGLVNYQRIIRKGIRGDFIMLTAEKPK